MFNNKKTLSDILSSFTSVKDELDIFIAEGASKEAELRTELKEVSTSNEKAVSVVSGLNNLLGTPST